MKVEKIIIKNIFLYFLIILLLLFCNFSSIKICKAIDSNFIFVGGIGEKNYSKIQDAIDNSSDNDTIIVLGGIFNETIIVNKSINLIGLDKNNVTINGNDGLYVFLIRSSFVNISGLTIQGGKIGIYISESNYFSNNFSGNNISKNLEAIRLLNSSNNSICNNIIQSNSDVGIAIYESCFNNINGNFFEYNGKAININEWSNYNIIEKNIFTENDLGLSNEFSFNNLVSFNYIGNNSQGIYLSNSKFNNITNNNIEFSKEYGIFISNSDENEISSNTFLKNNQDIKLDNKPPEINASGFELLLIFVTIFLFICIKKCI